MEVGNSLDEPERYRASEVDPDEEFVMLDIDA